jgi:hypothetical protein
VRYVTEQQEQKNKVKVNKNIVLMDSKKIKKVFSFYANAKTDKHTKR